VINKINNSETRLINSLQYILYCTYLTLPVLNSSTFLVENVISSRTLQILKRIFLIQSIISKVYIFSIVFAIWMFIFYFLFLKAEWNSKSWYSNLWSPHLFWFDYKSISDENEECSTKSMKIGTTQIKRDIIF
jgi:hypothetical protein